MGERVLKAGGIEIWSSGNELGDGVTSLSATSRGALAFEELRAILPEVV